MFSQDVDLTEEVQAEPADETPVMPGEPPAEVPAAAAAATATAAAAAAAAAPCAQGGVDLTVSQGNHSFYFI